MTGTMADILASDLLRTLDGINGNRCRFANELRSGINAELKRREEDDGPAPPMPLSIAIYSRAELREAFVLSWALVEAMPTHSEMARTLLVITLMIAGEATRRLVELTSEG